MAGADVAILALQEPLALKDEPRDCWAAQDELEVVSLHNFTMIDFLNG